MAENAQGSDGKGESLMGKIMEKFHGEDSSSSSSDLKPEREIPIVPLKDKVFRLFGRERPVHAVLGGGKRADVFLWRNKKISGGVLGVATVIWVLFEVMEYHLLTLLCHTLMGSLVIMFLWANAYTFIHKCPPQIPKMHLSDDIFFHFASDVRAEMNCALAMLRSVALGNDSKKFILVISTLWVASIVGSWCNFLTLFYISFVLLHTVPIVYEKYENGIDSLGEKTMVWIKKQYGLLDANVISKIPKGPLKSKST